MMRGRRGLSLVDAIATLIVLAAVTVPIASGIASMSRGSLQNYREMAVRSELVHQAEALRAASFANVTVGTTVTSIALPGGAANMTTTISLADYDGDLAADTSFKLIVISLQDREIRFYRSEWKS